MLRNALGSRSYRAEPINKIYRVINCRHILYLTHSKLTYTRKTFAEFVHPTKIYLFSLSAAEKECNLRSPFVALFPHRNSKYTPKRLPHSICILFRFYICLNISFPLSSACVCSSRFVFHQIAKFSFLAPIPKSKIERGNCYYEIILICYLTCLLCGLRRHDVLLAKAHVHTHTRMDEHKHRLISDRLHRRFSIAKSIIISTHYT